MHTLAVAPAAGTTVMADHIAVLVHKGVGSLVSTAPSRPDSSLSTSPVHLLQGMRMKINDAEELVPPDLLEWERRPGMSWCLPNCEAQYEIVTEMVNAGAFPDCDLRCCYVSRISREIEVLLAAEVIERVDNPLRARHGPEHESESWRFCPCAVPQLQSFWLVHSPRSAFRERAGIPLAQKTTFELLVALRAEGFMWKQWVNPKQNKRAFREAGLSEMYIPGSPKVWCSSGTHVYRQYLELLLRAEDLP